MPKHVIKHNKINTQWVHKPYNLLMGHDPESITPPDVVQQIANNMDNNNQQPSPQLEDVPITKPLPEEKSELEKLISAGYKFLTREDGKWLEKSPEHKSNISENVLEHVDDE